MRPLPSALMGSAFRPGMSGWAIVASFGRWSFSVAVVCFGGSCVFFRSDPIHDSEVEALGPEVPGIPRGPYHRAGQPCTVCHSSAGPAQTVFSLAGTVFSSATVPASQAGPIGVDGVTVGVVDNNGASQPITTNCVGNFFVTPDVFNPAFPILVQVSKLGVGVTTMKSHISRDSSCASCHSDPASDSSPGHVYLATQAPTINPNCPVSPVAQGM